MQFNQNMYNREILSYDEKIALAELEVAKAAERVQELKYEKSRFNLEMFLCQEKAFQENASQGSQSPQNPS